MKEQGGGVLLMRFLRLNQLLMSSLAKISGGDCNWSLGGERERESLT